MPDLVTIGSFASDALALGAQAAFKAFVSEVVKDAYHALKARLLVFAGHDVFELEKTPTSKTRAGVIAEIIDALPAEEQKSLRALAQSLLDAVATDPVAVGLDVHKLRAASVELGSINVTGRGLGARIDDADISGTVRVGDITVGARPGK